MSNCAQCGGSLLPEEIMHGSGFCISCEQFAQFESSMEPCGDEER